MTFAVVAGGGIAGLLAARMLADRGERVLLVERDAACGGLLGSIRDEAGVAFDHGAHLLSETGDPRIDGLLALGREGSSWRAFNVLRAGNWFGGAMNRDSPFPDARRIGDAAFRQGMTELAAAADDPSRSPPADLRESLVNRFGATFAERVAEPAVRKQLSVDGDALHPDTPFAIRRLVCADAGESRRLKQDRRFAETVAFASFEEGVGNLQHWYPREGGIGRWVDRFVEGLRGDGVDVACGRTIAAMGHADGRIREVTLDDGRCVATDRVAWTLPSTMLLRAAGIPFESRPPLARPIGLFHMTFDRPFDDANYHVTCYDGAMRTFRVTLYPSLRGDSAAAPFNCTAEVIGDATTDFPSLLPQVEEELGSMGITVPGAKLVRQFVRTVPMGFPATTHEFMEANATHSSLASSLLTNALLLGRARCPPFFTVDVLREVALQLDRNADV